MSSPALTRHQPFDLLESKLQPPRVRGRSVSRPHLLRSLDEAGGPPIVVACAAAGYGKTTLLAHWAAARNDVAWVSLDEHDDDPVVLLTYVATALDRVTPLDPGIFDILASPGAPILTKVVPRLAAALAGAQMAVVLVLDDLHQLSNPDSVDAIVALASQLPDGSRLVLSTRDNSALPMGRWRTRGLTIELGEAQLRMDEVQAQSLLAATGAGFTDAQTAELVRRTEGWPAGLYLAALSVNADTGAAPGMLLTGNNPLVVDFLRTELLASIAPDEVVFLMRTSVLERMSGPLCDALLETTGSGQMLEQLASTNRFVVAMDKERRWYRCHHLVRDLLGTELARAEPELISPLLSRASDWSAANGHETDAVRYAQANADPERVAQLIGVFGQEMFQSGRTATLDQWLDWLREHGGTQRPVIAVMAAMFYSAIGDTAKFDRWFAAAESGSAAGPMPDGTASIDSWRAMLRAIRCRDGMAAMLQASTVAADEMAVASPWRPTALILRGWGQLLTGAVDAADDSFVDTIEAGRLFSTPTTVPVVVPLAMAERALAAINKGEWSRASELAELGLWTARRSLAREAGLFGFVYAIAARTALHGGREPEALVLLAEARRRLPKLTHAGPILATQTRLEMTRSYLRLAHFADARVMLGDVEELLRRSPDLGNLNDQAAALQLQLVAPGRELGGASTLSPAEIRVLPLLSTHLSYAEIGERLFVSRHTVKSHAMSVYRKLDVNSRSAAVDKARVMGLL